MSDQDYVRAVALVRAVELAHKRGATVSAMVAGLGPKAFMISAADIDGQLVCLTGYASRHYINPSAFLGIVTSEPLDSKTD
ncbi:hypothetical protein AWL63_18945 [Sphingomonas panacis]|uniref:Uncharacterized protein n=1 Tax=Sphingomonas panacis TaxID=1560345 RepID=A0A1B3ZE50_9SPHN|nr:hypothetical protein AWL63_18945 [Sphingomonas panacis]